MVAPRRPRRGPVRPGRGPVRPASLGGRARRRDAARMNHPRLLLAAPILSLATAGSGCISGATDAELELETAVSELACTATKLDAFSSAEDEGRLVFSP